jgi:hypothetical protein
MTDPVTEGACEVTTSRQSFTPYSPPAEDTARTAPGLANVRISAQTVRRRLRESGLRARRPVVRPILKQRHRTTRLARDRARRR